jgi:hypothetical protein
LEKRNGDTRLLTTRIGIYQATQSLGKPVIAVSSRFSTILMRNQERNEKVNRRQKERIKAL